MAVSNPNGCNQFKADPRQELFKQYYFDRNSETFSNVLQSGIKAGFSKEYSKIITSQKPEWFSEMLKEREAIARRNNILEKAETKLYILLDSEDERVVADLVKHTTKTLGKDYYSDRVEHTGKDGKDLIVNVVNYADNNPV